LKQLDISLKKKSFLKERISYKQRIENNIAIHETIHYKYKISKDY
jgi:hypothetical protein